MGNAFSNVVKSQKKEEVNNVIADVMNCFLLRFIVHYKNRIVVKYTGPVDSRLTFPPLAKKLLSQCPAVDVPLLSGVVGKQREWFKSWANRYIIIRNEADNFRIDYYDASETSLSPPASALKGSIHPVGYYIESFLSDSEKYNLKDCYCIKLSPLNSKKSPWYLKVSILITVSIYDK